MTLPLLPGPRPARCSCCHHLVPTGRLWGGYGEKCARLHGLIPPRQPRTVRLPVVQDGPDLFDAADNPEDTNDQA